MKNGYVPKPEWLKIKYIGDDKLAGVTDVLSALGLNTICDQAACPNRMECFEKKTATFLILGRSCTRNCSFCNVEKMQPDAVDQNEPYNIATAVKELSLKYVVITSVTRDDLPDGGAQHFAKTITEIRNADKKVKIEVLIPDFGGCPNSLEAVINASPDVISHNVETVPRLYSEVRPMAVYERSLELLRRVKQGSSLLTKSGIMLGLGESVDEVYRTLLDLRDAGCDILTVGQYLAPSKRHHPVIEYIHPDVFGQIKRQALDMGFSFVASGQLVRSSYRAEEALNDNNSTLNV